MKKIKLVLLGLLVSVLLFSSVAQSQNNGSGIGVKNTPPTFVSIDIQEVEDNYHIEAVVSDYNGRGDLYRLNVNIFNTNGELISNFSYSQYDSPDRTTAIRIDSFTDHQGDYLIREECGVERYVGNDWFLENTTIKIRFVVQPLDGKTITIRANDVKMEEAYYEGPITSKSTVQTIIQGRAIPLVVSVMTAGLGTATVVYDRRNKNVLAKTVRQKMEEEID